MSLDLLQVLDGWLREERAQKRLLRYSSDLDPGKCERQIWLELHGAPYRADELGKLLMFEMGDLMEREVVVKALASTGLVEAVQVAMHPDRPAARRFWDDGHADIVTKDRSLWEIKTRRSHAFARALRGDGTVDVHDLVKSGHTWQASAYFHGLKDRFGLERVYVVELDREGSNTPVQVDLEATGLLIPEEAIATQEEHRARVAFAPEPPPVIARSTNVRVWKGKPKEAAVKVGKAFARTVSELPWNCGWCPFRGVSCDPGPDLIELELDDCLLEAAVEEGRKELEAGARGPVEVPLGERSAA